jgi:hypothetical protein
MADGFPDAAKEWNGGTGQQLLILALDDKRLREALGQNQP